jgi:hypothetical protein
MRQGLAGKIREIRLSTDKATGKPKGFGFVELADHVALTVCSRYPWAKLATRGSAGTWEYCAEGATPTPHAAG